MKDTSPLLSFQSGGGFFRVHLVAHETGIYFWLVCGGGLIALIFCIKLGMYFGTKHLGCFMVQVEQVLLKPNTSVFISRLNQAAIY
jgi:hypothetical protein